MKIFKVENMTKTYGEKILFDNISFSLTTNEKVGLLGINGTGKSSLLKCIIGKDTYDKGEIIKSKDFTLRYLPQEINLDSEKTVIDTIFDSDIMIMKLIKEYEKLLLEIEKDSMNEELQNKLLKLQDEIDKEEAWDATSNAKTILSKLGINMYYEKISNLSGGQKKRVALASVLIESPDLLLLDEPTNHLDFETISWLEGYLRRYKKGIIVVTHDRYFLDNVANKIFELDNSKLYEYNGNYSNFLEKKAERELIENMQYLKNKQLYKKELEWVRSGVKARTTKQQARLNRFDILEEKIDVNLSKNEIDINLLNSRLGKQVFELDKITKIINGKKLIDTFSLIINNKSRLGIIGNNGVGKSTFLNVLTGKATIDSGLIKTGQTVKIAYYSQFIDDMDPNIRMINYIKERSNHIENKDGSIVSAAQLLERFLFPMHTHGTMLSKLSGGERRRLFLLKLLMDQPNVLILDEPTNDLDTQTLTILEDYLDNFQGAVIVVSHDRYFLDKVVNELLIFMGDGIVNKYTGNFSEYIQNGGLLKQNHKIVDKEIYKINSRRLDVKKKMSYQEKKEWESIDIEIDILENKILDLEKEMIKESTNYERLNELNMLAADFKKQLDYKFERWEYLAEIADI